MKALCNTLVLMLASVLLASCGGGGGGSNSAFGPPSYVVTIQTASGTITTSSFTAVTVNVKTNDGGAVPDGTTVNLSVSPSTIGTVAGQTGSSGSSATNTTSGGNAAFTFTSSNQAGTAHLVASASIGGSTSSASANVTVNAGNNQDPRLQLSPSTTTLPVNPFAGESEVFPFPGNYLGSPYISEVTLTWRHSNGQLVAGTLPANVSIDPVTICSFSTLDDPTTPWTGETLNPPTDQGNEFLTLLGSGPVNVTGGNGVIFVHAGDVPGTCVLSVTGIDPDSSQTISSQLTLTVAGSASSELPSSINVLADGGVYVPGSGGPQSTVVRATVLDGDNVSVADPSGFNNVEFQIVGPSNSDARLSGINAAGQSVTGTKIDTVTHSGIASVTFLAGTVEGPVQVKATADRGDNNVDNQIQDGISATTTVDVSDGKLDSLTIDSPGAGTGVSGVVVEDPLGSGNYELTITVKGVDRQGNAVVPGTQIAFGDIDTPQLPVAATGPMGWFQISGSHGNPQEGGTLFTATDGKFTTAGGGAGPGDTLLVIGKQAEGAPAGNDDLESSAKITAINSATSLNVAEPFNLNDQTGVSVDNGSVLPYLIGRATFTAVQSPQFTDVQTSSITGEAITTLSYSANQIGKAVAVWAQGTGTDTNTSPGRTDTITDIVVFTLPGMANGAFITASPDPLLGNKTVPVTVCYYDGNSRPIPNFDISFALDLGGVGQGSVDGTVESGQLKALTGANGCASASVSTLGLATGTSATVTFSAGPMNAGGASVTINFVVNEGALQVSPCQFSGTVSPQTITIHVIDSGGDPLPNQSVTAACTVLSGAGTISATSPLNTDQTGTTYSVITVNPADATTIGYCTYTSGSLVQSVGVNTGSCSSGGSGFSPPP